MYHYSAITFAIALLLFASFDTYGQSENRLVVESGAAFNLVSQQGGEYKVRAYYPRPGFYLGSSYIFPVSENAFVLGGFIEYTRLMDLSEDILTDQNGTIMARSSKHNLRQMDFALSGLYRLSLGRFSLSTGAKFNFLVYGSSKSVYRTYNGKLKLLASPNHLNPIDVRIPVQVAYTIDRVSLLLQYERGLIDRLKGKGGVKEFNNVLKLGMSLGF